MLKAEVQIPPYQKIDKINEPQDAKTNELNKLDNNLRPTIQKSFLKRRNKNSELRKVIQWISKQVEVVFSY